MGNMSITGLCQLLGTPPYKYLKKNAFIQKNYKYFEKI